MLQYDVVIIGSGIAGMTCAIYLKRGGINPLIIEKESPGGQLNKIPIIENYPGFIEIDGPTLAKTIYDQVKKLNIDYLYEEVVEAKLDKDIKVLRTTNQEIKCKYVVIASGRSSKTLTKEDIKLIGKGISYCGLCDGSLYKNQDVTVVGGGTSAIREAQYLSKICNKVSMIIRSNHLNGEEKDIKSILDNKKIEVIYNSNIVKYNLENDRISSILLDSGKTIKTKCVFVTIGSIPNNDIYTLEKSNNFIVVYHNYMTSINNVYACGDIIKKDAYQLTTAVGEATTVAKDILSNIK